MRYSEFMFPEANRADLEEIVAPIYELGFATDDWVSIGSLPADDAREAVHGPRTAEGGTPASWVSGENPRRA